MRRNERFELRGIHHLALVCKDMARTVEFYSEVLGMPLVKTVELPGGSGQHFFFDVGNGDSLAFFWFPNAPEAAPGIASPRQAVGVGDGWEQNFATAVASMNHVAFHVAPDKIDEYARKLRERGIETSIVWAHDDSPEGMRVESNETTFIRSVYFMDPDGIMLEFAAWTRELHDRDADIPPKSACEAADGEPPRSPEERRAAT